MKLFYLVCVLAIFAVSAQEQDTCKGPQTCEGSAYNYSCCCSASGACSENMYDTIIKLDDDLWTVLSANDPKEADAGPANNRMLITKIGKDGLMIINGVNLCDSTLKGLKTLESNEEATIKYIVTPGDWHHVYLAQYNKHFPNAKIYIPPGRIPDQGDKFNYTTIDVNNPLPELQPSVTMIPMKGLRQPFPHLYTPRYEFGFFHNATATLITGDILWYWSCGPSLKERILFPGSSKGKITFWDALGQSMFLDTEVAKKSAQDFLALPIRRFINVHGPLGNMVQPDNVPSARALVKEAFTTGHGPLAYN